MDKGSCAIDGQEFPFAWSNPFSPADEERLEWCFEQYLRFPFMHPVRAVEAADSVREYGHRLLNMVFRSDAPSPRATFLT